MGLSLAPRLQWLSRAMWMGSRFRKCSRRFDFRLFLFFITALGLGDSPDFFAFTLSLLLPELTMALGRVWGLGDLRIFSGIIIDR